MTEPDDQDLDTYLAGDSEISRAYREASDESAPEALDNAVLEAAQEAAASRRRHWVVPAATAASAVLAIGIALKLPYGGADHVAEPAKPVATDTSSPKGQTDETGQGATTPSQLQRYAGELDASDANIKHLQGDLSDAEAVTASRAENGSGEPAAQADARPPAEAWLRAIQALRKAGRDETARAELRAFRTVYPDKELTDELAGLLDEATAD